MTAGAQASVRLPSVLAAIAGRAASFLGLWLVLLPSAKPGDLAVGAFATVAATWMSVRLLPPATGCLRYGSLALLMPHFLWASVLAGVDVAQRAFGWRVRVQPGYVSCPLQFPPGLARNTFSSITSLLPGSVPAGDSDGVLVYHALDTSQPVVEQLWAEEKRLARALVAGRGHG
ncbi:MAG: Na+/H+ antiporter subunit E [Arenimonas sp.]|nr:Na+/H+ antiporter subunit E [Arenimonas sp.]